MNNRISFSSKLAALTVMSGLSVSLFPISVALAAPLSTIRVSVSSTGEEGNSNSGSSYRTASSDNGRFVVFQSLASNLVAEDTNGVYDVFVRDLKTGVTKRVSVDSAGAEANGFSYAPSISANGRFVAFWSIASNLVPGDTNGVYDVFVRDLKTGVTKRVSVDSAGAEGNDFSANPSNSADGRFVAFQSAASNLVAGDNNGQDDIFVYDLKTGVTKRASVDSAGAEANNFSIHPSISANGRFVAFQSLASNLVAGDNNGEQDIFVRDLKTGVTKRVSVDSAGAESNNYSQDPVVSSDGRVAFWSIASNLVSGDNNGSSVVEFGADIFVHNIKTGVTERVSVDSAGAEANSYSYYPSISANGRFVVFQSQASNLVEGDTNGYSDAFVRDLKIGVTKRVSLDSEGIEGNSYSYNPSISANGRFVAFSSNASNLVEGDNNGLDDVFVRRRW